MELSGSGAAAAASGAIGVAVQKQLLDQMKVQGAKLTSMMDAAPRPSGSVNSPTQGRFVDAHA